MVLVVVLVAVLAALMVLVALAVRSAWRERGVDFIHQAPLGANADAVAAGIFDQIFPVLVRDGFRTAASGGHTTVLEHRYMPGWPILLAIFLFPIGLIALLARNTETIVIVNRDQVLEVHGSCSKVVADYITEVLDHASAESARASC